MSILIGNIIKSRIQSAIQQAQEDHLLPKIISHQISVERPQKSLHGDFATSLPLRLAKDLKLPPVDIANRLVQLISTGDEIERVWVEPPGFINFILNDNWLQEQVAYIIQQGDLYGKLESTQPEKIMVEFVSVNPTGPIHVGHMRGAVLGSTLSSILESSGHSVSREYYINDAGNQMDNFYKSVYAKYLDRFNRPSNFPSDGYRGSYVKDLADNIASNEGDRFLSIKDEDAISAVGQIAKERMLDIIKSDLETLNVDFDNWFSESSLYKGSDYKNSMKILKRSKRLSDKDGALWFISSHPEDKDNVVVRSNGSPTYFASDIAYHYNKFVERKYDRVINIWGADHQGHVSRLHESISALGINSEGLQIIIAQMVSLKHGGNSVKASKRSGEFVSLKELVDQVGPDACRYFFLSRAANSQMDFDTQVATEKSKDNPVYYIQYAHARIVGILKNATKLELDWSNGNVKLLNDPTELSLIRKMLMLPELINLISTTLEPHHLPHYALELASSFHWFYENCRVISSHPDDFELTLSRLRLVEATQIVLARSLGLMGMSTPEIM